MLIRVDRSRAERSGAEPASAAGGTRLQAGFLPKKLFQNLK
jgi:hypothetical protein